MNVRMYENICATVKIKITFLSWFLNTCQAVDFQLFNVDKKITRMTCNLLFITKKTSNRFKCAFN